jgi:hypothetical protein
VTRWRRNNAGGVIKLVPITGRRKSGVTVTGSSTSRWSHWKRVS